MVCAGGALHAIRFICSPDVAGKVDRHVGDHLDAAALEHMDDIAGLGAGGMRAPRPIRRYLRAAVRPALGQPSGDVAGAASEIVNHARRAEHDHGQQVDSRVQPGLGEPQVPSRFPAHGANLRGYFGADEPTALRIDAIVSFFTRVAISSWTGSIALTHASFSAGVGL